jgi:hypothetical protein
MERHRDAVVSASTDIELFYALARLSNARRDRHLEIALVPGGVELPDAAGVARIGSDAETSAHRAPVKLLPDYSNPAALQLFVSDVAAGWEDRPRVGDRVLSVNGQPVATYLNAIEPYIRYSTVPNLWWNAANLIPQRSALLPPQFYRENLRIELQRADERFTLSLPYLRPDSLTWTDIVEPRYDGFRSVTGTSTFDLHVSNDDLPVIVLGWHGFREDLVRDIDSLVAWAARHDALGHSVIVDATRSRGGSNGAYAMQRLASRPFKVPFGNLRMSDVIAPFIAQKRAEYERGRVDDGGVAETLDNGSWLMDWLDTDVTRALEAGDEYSNDVPFKLAHAPKESDGVLEPAPLHFTGSLVVFSGPRRGSHLDQFVATVVDNDLGYVIGMPAGGYSNTWEWEETLTFPETDQASKAIQPRCMRSSPSRARMPRSTTKSSWNAHCTTLASCDDHRRLSEAFKTSSRYVHVLKSMLTEVLACGRCHRSALLCGF